ncbi:MAG TPA: methyltransferase, partial [Bacteroidia bacterium]|nr:methyltransferase [Bacteroidia bacterium]
MHKEITQCRICGNKNLVSLLNLGDQALTGIFPTSKEDKITAGPLELVKCHPLNQGDKVCNLVQLLHSYDSSEMYGLNYGYRSGLNQSMVKHLRDIVAHATSLVSLAEGDLIIDIGSNDSTLLQGYPTDKKLLFYGIDPTGKKFSKYY